MKFTVGRFEIDIKVCDTLYHKNATKGDALRFMHEISALYMEKSETLFKESKALDAAGDIKTAERSERLANMNEKRWKELFNQLDAAGYYDTGGNGWKF